MPVCDRIPRISRAPGSRDAEAWLTPAPDQRRLREASTALRYSLTWKDFARAGLALDLERARRSESHQVDAALLALRSPLSHGVLLARGRAWQDDRSRPRPPQAIGPGHSRRSFCTSIVASKKAGRALRWDCPHPATAGTEPRRSTANGTNSSTRCRSMANRSIRDASPGHAGGRREFVVPMSCACLRTGGAADRPRSAAPLRSHAGTGNVDTRRACAPGR